MLRKRYNNFRNSGELRGTQWPLAVSREPLAIGKNASRQRPTASGPQSSILSPHHSVLITFLTGLILILSRPQPLLAQSNGITAPAPGDTLSGVVIVTGTASHPEFLRYEMAFLRQNAPEAGWIVFAEGSQAVVEGTLAIWDTTVGRDANAPVFPDGAYQLRLRVVRQDYNYDEYFVNGLTLSNSGPTPTPTPDENEPTRDAAATPPPLTTVETPIPDILPSLTPFPTPTRPATPENSVGVIESPDGPDGEAGVLGQIASVDTSGFGSAFWTGVRLAAYAFGALGLYIFLRFLFRLGWRELTGRIRQ